MNILACCLLYTNYVTSNTDGEVMSAESDLSEEILELIKEEKNLENKAYLLVQFKMAQMLQGIDSKLADLSKKFTDHTDGGDFRKGKLAGMKSVIVPVFSLLQIILLSSITYFVHRQDANTTAIIEVEKSLSAMAVEVNDLKAFNRILNHE